MITAFIIAKNDHKSIEKALKSLTFAKEILVFDESEGDQILNIARKYTDKVVKGALPESFAEKRNLALEKATQPWIFFVDCDEEVPQNLAEEIKKAVRKKEFSNYWIPRKNYIFGLEVKHGAWWPDYQLRLFRKVGAIFEGKVHERVKVLGKIGFLKNFLIHTSYGTVLQFQDKMNLYSTLEAQMKKEKGITFRVYYLFYWPLREFIRRYFRYQGFRDGLLGLALAFLLAINKFIVALKLWEKEKNG